MIRALEVAGVDVVEVRAKALSGVVWSSFSQIGKQVIALLTTIAISRALRPEDFGLLALVMVGIRFAGILGEVGFSSALIQRKEISEDHRSSVFWVNLLIGCSLMGLMVLLSSSIARFFEQPEIRMLIVLASTNLVITPLYSVHRALLRRDLAFKTVGMIDLFGVFVTGVTGVAFVYSGMGVSSLILMELSGNFAVLVASVGAYRWWPRRWIDWAGLSDLMGFSLNLLGSNMINYWVRNLDNLLIGKFIGEYQLGLYSRAYGLMLLPVNQISGVIGNVMFPSLSRLGDDLEKIRSVYLRATAAIFLVTAPTMLGFVAVANTAIPTLLGSQWQDMVPIVRVLCPLGAVQSILSTVGWIYLSQARADLLLKWNLFTSPITMSSFAVGIYFGDALAVAIANAVTYGIILGIPMFAIPARLIGLRWSDMIANLRGITGCSLFMMLLVIALDTVLPKQISGIYRLAILIPTGCGLYFGALWMFRIEAMRNVLRLLLESYRS